MQPEGVVFDTVAQPRGESEMKELARLADSLVEQLADTRHHYEQIRTDLDRYEPRVSAPASAQAQAQAPAPMVEQPEETYEDNAERIRLFALNLALSGSSREDVIAELHDNFGVDDPGEILDAVFPETTRTRQRRRRFGRRKGS
jgi:hypothetical protein